MAERKGLFYGWVVLVVAWVAHGFGIAPAYYSWGVFGPALIEDLDLSRASFGLIFGAFTFTYSTVGLLGAALHTRIGIREIMTVGFGLSATGFWYMSQANSLFDCILGFSLVGGIGIGLSTILPALTLGQNWFFKYRARALAIILTAGGIVGIAVPKVAVWFLEHRSWSEGWIVIGGISAVLAVVVFFVVRDRPEDSGQFRDGVASDPELAARLKGGEAPEPSSQVSTTAWTARAAIRTPQFGFLLLCGLAYSLPWGIVVVHGRLHMDDIGLDPDTIASVMSWMILISIAGRFSGALGDFFPPQKVLGAALIVEAAGVGCLIVANSTILAYISVILIGLGYGAGFISILIVISNFFGRRAFWATTGIWLLIGGMIGGLASAGAGIIADATGFYTISFVILLVVGCAGGATAFLCRHPGPAPQVQAEAA